MGCSCPLPKGKVPGVWCRFPAISQPLKGQLYGWLPLSDAAGIIFLAGCHCLMLNGILPDNLCLLHNGIFFGNRPLSDTSGIIHFMKPNNQSMPVLRRPERPTII